MKKNLFIAALAILSLASCKKDRVCECVETSTKPGFSGKTQAVTLTAITKSTAKKACISSSYEYSSGGNTYTKTTTCTLK